ncbi:hypothetical protein [Radiobacillus sp. PE A8.2]|uniref:hypothetical protein n=1 Tax=Radiobacillus sp. PE A8.2 TaxID=3380349 RepID=UPI00388CEE38
MSDKIQKLKNSIEDTSLENNSESENVREIVNDENNKLYRRIAGHFHKNNDELKQVLQELEDLKIFIRYAIKSENDKNG